jgi:hypothetical protein
MEKFGLKFGQNLREINFIVAKTDDIIKYTLLLRLCPNLISLNDKHLTHLLLFVDSNQLLMTKLWSIRIEVNPIELHSKDIKL